MNVTLPLLISFKHLPGVRWTLPRARRSAFTQLPRMSSSRDSLPPGGPLPPEPIQPGLRAPPARGEIHGPIRAKGEARHVEGAAMQEYFRASGVTRAGTWQVHRI